MITFYFNAPTQTWTKVTLNIWITSRNDLIVRTDTLRTFALTQRIYRLARAITSLFHSHNTLITPSLPMLSICSSL